MAEELKPVVSLRGGDILRDDLGRTLASVFFVGPGCWQWSVHGRRGKYGGTASSREQAHEKANAAAVALASVKEDRSA